MLLDDTEPITCRIENWQNVNGHTVSINKVFNKINWVAFGKRGSTDILICTFMCVNQSF